MIFILVNLSPQRQRTLFLKMLSPFCSENSSVPSKLVNFFSSLMRTGPDTTHVRDASAKGTGSAT